MLFLSQRTYNTPTTNYFRYNALRGIFASRLTLTAIQNFKKMNNKNRLVAPVIEKTVCMKAATITTRLTIRNDKPQILYRK